MTYISKYTGSTDTREGWISSYDLEELDDRGLTAEQAFAEDEGVTLFEVVTRVPAQLIEEIWQKYFC